MSSLTASLVGAAAAGVLARPARGRVLAVLAPVAYLEFAGGLVALARAGTEPGPLALMTDAPRGQDLRRTGLAPGQAAEAGASGIVAGPLRVAIGAALVWTPPAPPVSDAALLARGLLRLRQALPGDIAEKGLGGVLAGGNRLGAADGALAAARDWLAAPLGAPDWAGRLVGLGPGLTPSGDDFLGGALIALRATGRRGLADRLWQEVAPRARRDTGPISFALLAAAAAGIGSAPLHDALNAILAAGDPRPALARLAETGHSSGWDALAGLVTVLDAAAGARADRAA